MASRSSLLLAILDAVAQPVERRLRRRISNGPAPRPLRRGRPARACGFSSLAMRAASPSFSKPGGRIAGGGNDGDGPALRAVQQVGDQVLALRPSPGRGPAIVHDQHQRTCGRRAWGCGPAAGRPAPRSAAPPPARRSSSSHQGVAAGVCSSSSRPRSSRSGGNKVRLGKGGVTRSSHQSAGSATSAARIQGVPKLICSREAIGFIDGRSGFADAPGRSETDLQQRGHRIHLMVAPASPDAPGRSETDLQQRGHRIDLMVAPASPTLRGEPKPMEGSTSPSVRCRRWRREARSAKLAGRDRCGGRCRSSPASRPLAAMRSPWAVKRAR